jgi:hypothetical protein
VLIRCYLHSSTSEENIMGPSMSVCLSVSSFSHLLETRQPPSDLHGCEVNPGGCTHGVPTPPGVFPSMVISPQAFAHLAYLTLGLCPQGLLSPGALHLLSCKPLHFYHLTLLYHDLGNTGTTPEWLGHLYG